MTPPPYPTELHLVRYPAPVLRQKAQPVTVFDAGLQEFCKAMLSAMDEEHGVGLAAPQAGVSARIFVTNHMGRAEGALPDYRVWINPRLENCEGTTTYEEGCLSFPGIYATVTRHNAFDIVWNDTTGAEHRQHLDVTAGEFLGIVVQHELDHLDGVVFVDHLSPAQITLIRRRLRDLEDRYRKETGARGTVLRR